MPTSSRIVSALCSMISSASSDTISYGLIVRVRKARRPVRGRGARRGAPGSPPDRRRSRSSIPLLPRLPALRPASRNRSIIQNSNSPPFPTNRSPPRIALAATEPGISGSGAAAGAGGALGRRVWGAGSAAWSRRQVRRRLGRVGEPHRVDEQLLEPRLGRGLDLLDARTAASISARWPADSSARTAPAPAALPTERTRSTGTSGTSPSTFAYSGSMCAPNAPARRTDRSRRVGPPACSHSRSMPARSAAFANWIARTSSCVTSICVAGRRRAGTRTSGRRRRPVGLARPRRSARCRRRRSIPDEVQLADHLDDPGAADPGDVEVGARPSNVGSSDQHVGSRSP